MFASKQTLRHVPKTAGDTMYFTATSFDFSEDVAKACVRDENMTHTFTIGGHKNKYLSHPSGKVPLLTHAFCGYRRDFKGQRSGDEDINRSVMAQQRLGAGGASAPKLNTGTIESTYLEDFADSLSPEARRNARREPFKGNSSLGGGGMHVLKSTSHEAHSGAKSLYGSRGFEGGFANNLGPGVLESSADFFCSRYQLEHTPTGSPASPAFRSSPSSPSSPDRRRRRLRAGQDILPEGLVRGIMDKNLEANRSAPSLMITVPITHLGAGTV